MELHSGSEHGRDDLLQATVGDDHRVFEPPWRVASQIYVAFFGGSLAVTVIAWVNARRLRMEDRSRLWILVAGAIAIAATFALYLAILDPSEEIALASMGGRRWARWGSRIVAVVLWIVLARIQNPAARRYQVRGDGEYSSLWLPGLGAVFGLGFIQAAVLLGVLYLIRG